MFRDFSRAFSRNMRNHPSRSKIAVCFCRSDGAESDAHHQKAYGGAYVAMNSKGLGADLVFASNAEIAVMGAEGAASILYSRDIQASDDPEKTKREKSHIRKGKRRSV